MLASVYSAEMYPSVLLHLETELYTEGYWRCLCLVTGNVFFATTRRWTEQMSDIIGERVA